MDKEFYTTEAVRDLDLIAINEYKIPSFSLMTRAGEFAFKAIVEKWSNIESIRIFCGVGNNGGDGFVVAKYAALSGYDVEVVLCKDEEQIKGDAKKAYLECKDKNISIVSWSKNDFTDKLKVEKHQNLKNNKSKEKSGSTQDTEIIVDALFGTGLNKKLDEYWIKIINYMNNIPAKKVAIDVPSGLNANTGALMGGAFIADVTVTFVGKKQGLYTGCARDYCGEIIFNNLQIPKEAYSKVSPSGQLIDLEKLKNNVFSNISNCANKSAFGHALIIGGNYGMLGAAILAANGALHAGAGLVTVATRDEHSKLISIHTPEVMSKGIDNISNIETLIEKASVILIGPGLGQDEWSQNIFSRVIKLQKNLIIDADGLNLLSKIKEYTNPNCILTPHPKEASRLLGISTEEVEQDRFISIKNLHNKYKSNVILKGAGTIVYGEDKKYYITTYGNYGMASGGMGDVLAGVIAGIVARGVSLIDSSKLAVAVHSLASDKEVIHGKKGMLATDLLPWIRTLLN